MPLPSELQASYILHRKPYRESSFILDIFSVDAGRLSIVAKGQLGSKHSNPASLQVFQPLLMSWFGRGELKTLSKFEVPSAPMLLQGVPLYCAYYLNELVLNMMPLGEPSSKIFIKYGTSLESLKNGSNIEETLRSFELTLLDYLGVLPDLQSDEHGEAIQSSKVYRLGDLGFTLCPNEAGTGLWHGEVLLQCAAMLERNDRPLENVSIKPFTRFMVDRVLNGRSLKSREMLKQVMRLKLN